MSIRKNKYQGTNVPKQPIIPPMPKKRRYIDADKLIDDLEHDIAIDQDHILYVGINMREKELIQFDKDCKQNCIDMLSKAQTADVVEIVRCKDCKHKPNGYTDDDVLRYPNFPHEENNPCPCQVYEDEWYSWIPNDDFYCSYGERKDD